MALTVVHRLIKLCTTLVHVYKAIALVSDDYELIEIIDCIYEYNLE